ncbi:MAG: ACT domain-containing protein [Rhodopseudomonas palustris]|nr:ACT domain-containing protein [Rhodopseudomonas palustris]
MIEDVLVGKLRLPEVVAKRASGKGKLKPFTVEPEVAINNQWSDRYTVIEVSGLDRPGLLYQLTTAISKLNLNIASAHVATFGDARPRRVLRHRSARRADHRADPAGRDQARADPPARQWQQRAEAGGVAVARRSERRRLRHRDRDQLACEDEFGRRRRLADPLPGAIGCKRIKRESSTAA